MSYGHCDKSQSRMKSKMYILSFSILGVSYKRYFHRDGIQFSFRCVSPRECICESNISSRCGGDFSRLDVLVIFVFRFWR